MVCKFQYLQAGYDHAGRDVKNPLIQPAWKHFFIDYWEFAGRVRPGGRNPTTDRQFSRCTGSSRTGPCHSEQ